MSAILQNSARLTSTLVERTLNRASVLPGSADSHPPAWRKLSSLTKTSAVTTTHLHACGENELGRCQDGHGKLDSPPRLWREQKCPQFSKNVLTEPPPRMWREPPRLLLEYRPRANHLHACGENVSGVIFTLRHVRLTSTRVEKARKQTDNSIDSATHPHLCEENVCQLAR